MRDGIDIVLSTYNGEHFLKEQIDSILSQTDNRWTLIIRDDGSTDATLGIVREFIFNHPNKIILIDDNEHLGSCQSFSRLLEHASSDYIMFCDQDDVWLPDKVASSFRKMSAMETAHGKETPLLVHSDLQIVAADLSPCAESMWQRQKINPISGSRLNKLLQKNVVTGCATMINRSLRDLALPVPETAIMHDWWLALVAAAFGNIGIIPESGLFYRQHRDNAIGANRVSYRSEIASIIKPADRKAIKAGSQLMLRKYVAQARSFADQYRSILTGRQSELLDVFSNLDYYDVFTRKYYIIKHRLYYNNPLITLGMLLFKWK
jgi:glycosyltransferase involved in cell wall biosynthesis